MDSRSVPAEAFQDMDAWRRAIADDARPVTTPGIAVPVMRVPPWETMPARAAEAPPADVRSGSAAPTVPAVTAPANERAAASAPPVYRPEPMPVVVEPPRFIDDPRVRMDED
ncbi:MAG: hypothetical protein ACRYGL_00435, partial [Janthinobacterium lividum]